MHLVYRWKITEKQYRLQIPITAYLALLHDFACFLHFIFIFLILSEFLSYHSAVTLKPSLNGILGLYPSLFNFAMSGHLLKVLPSAGFSGYISTFLPKYFPTSSATFSIGISSIVPIW